MLISALYLGTAIKTLPRIYWRFRREQGGKVYPVEVYANKQGSAEDISTVRISSSFYLPLASLPFLLFDVSHHIILTYDIGYDSLTQATDTTNIQLAFAADERNYT